MCLPFSLGTPHFVGVCDELLIFGALLEAMSEGGLRIPDGVTYGAIYRVHRTHVLTRKTVVSCCLYALEILFGGVFINPGRYPLFAKAHTSRRSWKQSSRGARSPRPAVLRVQTTKPKDISFHVRNCDYGFVWIPHS